VGVHVGFVGRVVSYDHEKQTATIQPVVKGRRRNEDGDLEFYLLPQITNVPVEFPQGGGGAYSITFPLAVGDLGMVRIMERSHDEWRTTGAESTQPQHPRRFDLTDATFYPGISSPADPLDQIDESAMVIAGDLKLGDKSASELVALASLVLDRLNKLQTAFDQHMHATAGTGPPVGPTPVPGVIPVGQLASVAATKVRAL
jgi:hypothetical protein